MISLFFLMVFPNSILAEGLSLCSFNHHLWDSLRYLRHLSSQPLVVKYIHMYEYDSPKCWEPQAYDSIEDLDAWKTTYPVSLYRQCVQESND